MFMRYKFRISLLQPFDGNRLSGWSTGVSAALSLESDSLVEAFCSVNEWFTQQGRKVTVLATTPEQRPNPLGFSDDELSSIKKSGIEIETGFHKSEVQIESLEENRCL